MSTWSEVLARLSKHSLSNWEKCSFMKDSVEYLEHQIDAEGFHTLPSKVETIVEAPAPKNITELHSYGKFIPNFSSKLHSLHALLKTGTGQRNVHKLLHRLRSLSEAPVLDPKLLAGDTSNYRIGAVLSNVHCDGQEHPIAFTSCSLSSITQVQKEALSLIHRICKFFNYIYDWELILATDHLFNSFIWSWKWSNNIGSRQITELDTLFIIVQLPTKAHANVDGLSLPATLILWGTTVIEISARNASWSAHWCNKASNSQPCLVASYW